MQRDRKGVGGDGPNFELIVVNPGGDVDPAMSTTHFLRRWASGSRESSCGSRTVETERSPRHDRTYCPRSQDLPGDEPLHRIVPYSKQQPVTGRRVTAR